MSAYRITTSYSDDELRNAAKRYRLLPYDRLIQELNALPPPNDRTPLEQYVRVEMYDEVMKRTKAMPIVKKGVLFKELAIKPTKDLSRSERAIWQAINEDDMDEVSDPRIEIGRLEGPCGHKLLRPRAGN